MLFVVWLLLSSAIAERMSASMSRCSKGVFRSRTRDSLPSAVRSEQSPLLESLGGQRELSPASRDFTSLAGGALPVGVAPSDPEPGKQRSSLEGNSAFGCHRGLRT